MTLRLAILLTGLALSAPASPADDSSLSGCVGALNDLVVSETDC